MSTGKQMQFVCDGDLSSSEFEVDFLGEVAVPKKGDTIERHGKQWKVAYTQDQTALNDNRLPTVMVFLIAVAD